MHLHELRFVSTAALSRAFDQILACPDVEDCLADRASLTLRFSAPSERVSSLLARFYRRGDLLRWEFHRAALAC